jgi:UDP-N-acetylenolpyruvoylglucosamine reductase
LGEAVVNIPGRHNVLNALAVAALASELGVPFRTVAEAVGTFSGARRRFDTRFRSAALRVVDDYAHHPTEIAATIAAARGLAPSRVLCVFQPHRFSRTRLLGQAFGPAFDGADRVFVTGVYAAGEPPEPGVSGQTVVDAINARRPGHATSTPSLAEAALAAGAAMRQGDLVLVLGAGDVHRVATALAADAGVLEALREALGGEPATLKLYEPMARHTTILTGGPAQFWVEVHSLEALSRTVRFLRAEGIPLRVVGRGSNLLVRDGGVRGAVVHPAGRGFEQVIVEGNLVRAGSGARLKKLTSAAAAAGLTGFEWMEGVPGTLGGALRMNAGAMGHQTFDQVESVTFLTQAGALETKPGHAFAAGYRNVPELAENYAVSAVLRGTPATAGQIASLLAGSKAKRKATQPVAASAGCIFKNPGPLPAGRLVEELGFKGRSHGAAQVSDVHGNFIVNRGGARAADVLALIDEIREAAARERGLHLETEVQVIGQDEPVVLAGGPAPTGTKPHQ